MIGPQTLRRRLLVGSVTLVLGLSLASVGVTVQREIRHAEAALATRGKDLVEHLARAGRLGVLANDPSALEGPTSAAMAAPGVVGIRWMGSGGEVLRTRGVLEGPGTHGFLAEVVAAAPADDEGALFLGGGGGGEVKPTQRVGKVEVALDGADVRRLVNESLVGGALLMVLFLLAGCVGAWFLSRHVLEPVAALEDGVRRVSRGDLAHRIPEVGPAEVAALAVAYNEMATALSARTEELERQTRDLEEFVYIASHDLQSPLISIQGFAERLAGTRGPELDDEQERWISRITANVDHMGAMIRGILDLSRLNVRQNPVEDVDSGELVERALAPLRPILEDRNVELVIQGGSWPQVRGDVPRLRAVFTNLVDNALKFLGEDNSSPRIEIGFEGGQEHHAFWVRDNGVGIAPEHQDRVFKPLERLKSVEAHGSGMGLTLVRKIVEAHGGEVTLDSSPGQGTTFRFTLSVSSPAQ